MLVLFLGPGFGRMEFQPLDAEVDTVELDVGPGTLLLLRSDGLTHRFFSTARSLALSCFLMEDATHSWRRRFGVPVVVTPVCRDLMDWAKEHWEESRRNQSIGDKGQELDSTLPGQWQRMASQVFQMGPQIAVRGTSCKLPASYSDAGFWCGAETGCDLLEEVPLCRWDHADVYDPDRESWKWGKTSCNHGSFIDGIELFDNKFFGISPVESRGMDPGQRHILETSYEALYFSGFQKKSLMRSLIGVYIGAATSEFGFAPQDCSMSGTGGANSITSNRISFCLGLQGPSFTIDAQGAAALAALTNGAMSLRLQTDLYKPNHTALVGGVYLMLAGVTWILLSAKGHLSHQGRCMTFDQSADGYAKSEGVANLVLTRMDDQNETEEESKPKGIIAATHSSHGGRSASLTAPCGPMQGEMIHQALRQAAIAASTMEAVECFGHGVSMQDAVEAQVTKHALRGSVQDEVPLALTSCFSQAGMPMEAAGMAQILKVLITQKYGTIVPLLHLQQLNPHIEDSLNECALFASEHVQLEGLSSYHGITGRSIGGTMCHVITLGNVQVEQLEKPAIAQGEEATYETSREARELAASTFWLSRKI